MMPLLALFIAVITGGIMMAANFIISKPRDGVVSIDVDTDNSFAFAA